MSSSIFFNSIVDIEVNLYNGTVCVNIVGKLANNVEKELETIEETLLVRHFFWFVRFSEYIYIYKRGHGLAALTAWRPCFLA